MLIWQVFALILWVGTSELIDTLEKFESGLWEGWCWELSCIWFIRFWFSQICGAKLLALLISDSVTFALWGILFFLVYVLKSFCLESQHQKRKWILLIHLEEKMLGRLECLINFQSCLKFLLQTFSAQSSIFAISWIHVIDLLN